jgi:hypothetical protein
VLALEVIQRAQSETLRSGGVAIPTWDKLAADLDLTTKTFALSGRTGVTVPPDSILEFDDDSGELALNEVTSGTSVQVYERGYMESSPATHTAGTRVIVNNPYNKVVLLNHLKAVVAQLYGFGLYRPRSSTALTYNAITPIELPADARDTYAHMWVNRSGSGTLGYLKLRKGSEFDVLYDFSPIKVQFFGGGQQGFPLVIPYKADYGAVTSLSSDLDALGIPSSLQPQLAYAVASMALMGKEAPNVEAESIRRAQANANVPVGSRLSVGNALWQRFLNAIALERSRLLESNPPTITYDRSA